MDIYFEIAGNQIDGARDYQEDAFLTTYLDDAAGGSKTSALVIMADGMGGHAAGNIASNMVVSTFNKAFTGEFGKRDLSSVLRDCLDKANNSLKESIKETPALDGMGCTMVGAALTQGKLWWVSVGDSHLYLIRGRELAKQNEDHSYGGYLDRMKAQGMDIEPEPGLSRNMLMSAMTGDDIAEADCPDSPLELKVGDRLVIASDGLDTLSDGGMLQFSAWAETPKECVDALLKAVEDAGKPRQDNTTVVVVDVLEQGAESRGKARPATAEADDRTQPVEEEEMEDTTIPALAGQDVATTVIEEPDEGRRGKGLIIGVAALVLVALAGVGAWFMLGGEKPPVPIAQGEPTTAEPIETGAPPAAGGPESQAEPSAGEEPAAVQAQPEPAAQPEPVAVPEPAQPEPVAVPEPAAGVEPQPQIQPQPAVPEPAPEPPREFRDALKIGGEGPLMVRLPGGTFAMGTIGFSASQDEVPQHEVTMPAFAIGKYEVTFAEYELFAVATGRDLPDDRGLDKQKYPVVFVSWEDARAYTKWLSEQTGQSYRIPSEAEWEYAARANTRTAYWWGASLGAEHAHCADCNSGLDSRRPTKVGRFEPNPFGLYDTAGNVQEWVQDCYKKNYVGAPTDGSVWEHGECTYRVTRGGAFDSPGTSLRSSKRNKRRPTTGYDAVGIRIARDL